MIIAMRDAGGHGDDRGGEQEVGEDDGDPVGARPRPVATPDHAAHGDDHRCGDEATPADVLGDVDLGRRSFEPCREGVAHRLDDPASGAPWR